MITARTKVVGIASKTMITSSDLSFHFIITFIILLMANYTQGSGGDLIMASVGQMKSLTTALRDLHKALPGNGKPEEAIRIARSEGPAD